MRFIACFLAFLSHAFGAIQIHAIVNAAEGGWNRVAAGEIISIYGYNLGPEPGVALEFNPDIPVLPNLLAKTVVRVGGQDAPLLYASNTQINAQVPQREDMQINADGTVTVQVCREAMDDCSNVLRPWFSLAAPGIFGYVDEYNRSWKLVQSFSRFAGTGKYVLVRPETPAERSEDGSYYLILWGTGFGGSHLLKSGRAAPGLKIGETPVPLVTNLSLSVVVRKTDHDIEFISNPLDPNIKVYAAPGFVGLDQVIVKLPGDLKAGEHNLEIYVGGGLPLSATIFTQ